MRGEMCIRDRGWVLHTGGARFVSDGHADSDHDDIKCASTAGDGVAGAGVANGGIFAFGDAHGDAGTERVFPFGIVSAGAGRGELAGGVGDYGVGGSLSGVFHAEFAGAGGPGGCGIYVLGIGRIYKGPAMGCLLYTSRCV